MNGQEIRNRIDENNKKIHAALNKFILNDEINKLVKQNADLRSICKHEFVGGVCKFCDTAEDNNG